MALVFELGFPLLWLYLGFRLWQKDRWQASLLVAFYFFCLVCEAVAIRFGEYFYSHHLFEICPPGPSWREASLTCPQPDLCLPLGVPCLESALFFAGWAWAARREPSPVLRPLAGAVLAVIADLIFDPVAARGQLCGTGEQWDGIGLWTWLLDPADPGHYFGIPVDNALAWLASCAGFGWAAIRLPEWKNQNPAHLSSWGRAGLAAQVAVVGLVATAFIFFLLDLLVTPPDTTAAYRLPALFVLLGGLFAWLLQRALRAKVKLPADPLDRAASVVLASALLYPLLALIAGYDQADLYPLWALAAAALFAYWASGRSARQRS